VSIRLIFPYGYLPNNPDIAASTKATATIAPVMTAIPDRNSKLLLNFDLGAFRARYFNIAMTQIITPLANNMAGLNIMVKRPLSNNSANGIATFLFMEI